MAGADWPDESDGHADRRDDQGDGGRAGRGGGGGAEPETRTRQEYYADLRVAVSAQESHAARRAAAGEHAAVEKWGKQAEESRWMWTEYQRKWPPAERPGAGRPDDPPGKDNKVLDDAASSRVEAACDQIAQREKDTISPAMRAIESQDPDRHLAGFEHRLKGPDRLKEKITDRTEEKGRTLQEAISLIPDAIRYTFEYDRTCYTQGVWADITRMKKQGFELVTLKNFWEEEQYKGINSQWIEQGTGQRFELQFHTHISFEAKQLTHDAYERLRSGQPDEFEKMVLKAFQRKVSAEIPVPPGAVDIPDYPERGPNAR